MSSSVATLLFTDIEGSTRLWEADAKAMSHALALHDELARASVESNHGVVVKMTGDGMYATFDDPLHAVVATATMQAALADLVARVRVPLRVRAGLHTGMVERRNDDVFGSTANRAARIMSAAHGEQILVSQAVADGLRGRLQPPMALRDLGSVRLRDLAGAEHVYQLVDPRLRATFPALRSLEATPNNLPQQQTSFIGRERELAEAKSLLERTRLLTLLGMGGLGKTRLALQIAADVLDSYPDGVWFLDFAPLQDASLVPNVAAHVLGVREEPGTPMLRTLCAHLRDLDVLLIVDNCEHLIRACAELAHAVLVSAPKARIVATSREALRIGAEQAYPVLPLAVPERKATGDAVLRSDAVQLFIERARQHRPAFAPTAQDAAAVGELCARLEGIPLALELAAARMRSLSIDEINARLSDRFRLLTGGSRVALERQQTLRALVSWSYDLLQRDEQIVLDRLSCFVSGFDLEAAEVVCGADPIDRAGVLDLVTSLVEKSLVMVEQADNGSRYGMLETIREFAHERRKAEDPRFGMQRTVRDFAKESLDNRDDLATTAVRHCEHYLAIAKKARVKLQSADQAAWTRRLETELGNLRAAIALALSGGVDPIVAVKLEVALMRFRMLRGYSTEGRNNIRAALALPALQQPTAARAHALYTAGVLSMNQGDYVESGKALAESLEIRRALGNTREIAATLTTLASHYLCVDEPGKARDCEEQALDIFRELGDRVGEGIGLLNLGGIALRQGETRRAEAYVLEALDTARGVEHLELESECERNLGELAMRAGETSAAATRFERSVAICRKAEDRRGEAIAVWWLGRVDLADGHGDSAGKRFAEALPAFAAFGMNSEALDCLRDVASVLRKDGRLREAALLHAASAAGAASLGLRRDGPSQARAHSDVDALRAALGARAFDDAWAAGQRWTLDEAIGKALESLARAPVTI